MQKVCIKTGGGKQMIWLIVGFLVGFVLGEINAKAGFFYVGRRKRKEPTAQDVIVGWNHEK